MAVVVENPSTNAGVTRGVALIPGLESSTGGRNGNSLQYSCLGNFMGRGAWWALAHGVTIDMTEHELENTHTHTITLCMEGGAVFHLMDLPKPVGALWWKPWIKELSISLY